ncbi:MAG: hypothetical protein AVDCRST_MAG60-892 [uncultured Nocardioides sp.]|uniref:Protein-glutamine gamma-glutamyltransferase-like C-terminal domain-containing protein n=1 Tax=uncultured Nocardioides sp. TaxID=198441 RepID=A0A6J4N8H7_9ACTN|nr:MAG: hypothetical protein AVDCRST_MAG60-892 [uncultured Nocardioides sp.]
MRWALPLEPPLVPSPEEGRGLLRRELLDPEYHRDDLVRRLLEWVRRRILDVLEAASDAPPLSTFAAMAVGLVVVLGLSWLATRARTSPHAPGAGNPVLPDVATSAAQWRERAGQAHRDGLYSDALVHAFRALAAGQVEGGRLGDAPGATAHEVAEALRSAYPAQAASMTEGARLFDLVLYGDRPATREQA